MNAMTGIRGTALLCAATAWLILGSPLQGEDQPTQPLITNVFQDAELRAVLQDIASQANVAIICDVSVGGSVSVDLDRVPLDEALRRVLMAGAYVYRQVAPDCYLVGSGDPKQPTFSLLSETEVIPLNHIRPQRFSDLLLSEFYAPYVNVNGDGSLVVVTGPPELIARVKADLAKIDRPKDQIMIEALVTDIHSSTGKELSIDWRMTTGVAEPEGTRTVSFEGMTLGYTSLQMKQLLIALQALFRDGLATIRANPRVVALDGEEAEIFVGREEYFSLLLGGTVGYPYYRLESIRSGITLKIRAHRAEGDQIVLDIAPEVSDVIGKGTGGLPVVNRRTVKTKVRVTDGETVVIGGLVAELERRSKAGVPLLQDLPLLGFLFSSSSTSRERSEVVVLITPHVLRSTATAGALSGSGRAEPAASLTSAADEGHQR
jgi:type II secretory pathway component GspD/PulD (secretin)